LGAWEGLGFGKKKGTQVELVGCDAQMSGLAGLI
jgi:hypothetical protein